MLDRNSVEASPREHGRALDSESNDWHDKTIKARAVVKGGNFDEKLLPSDIPYKRVRQSQCSTRNQSLNNAETTT